MTTVAELIAELQKLPQDAQVILSRDAEGTGYSPILTPDIAVGTYTPESIWSGTFSGELSTPGAVCLWPTA